MTDMSTDASTPDDWTVVVNDEGRYGIWPATLSVPSGWRGTEAAGGRADCLTWIEQHWVDARPAGVGGRP
jgi:MbtH protein